MLRQMWSHQSSLLFLDLAGCGRCHRGVVRHPYRAAEVVHGKLLWDEAFCEAKPEAGVPEDEQKNRFCCRFSTQDTRPVGDRWCDPIQLVDGHWSADGSSVVVADVAGQWHLYSCGAFTFPARPIYDHFLSSDYAALVRDGNQFVLDAESQQPPHISQQKCSPAPLTLAQHNLWLNPLILLCKSHTMHSRMSGLMERCV